MKIFFHTLFLKIFQNFGLVLLSNDSSSFDRFIWLKNNLIPAKENGKLLDVGCGNGWSLFLSCKFKYNVIGLSHSKEDIEKILKKSTLINKSVNAIVAEVKDLDKLFLNNFFDVIINLENIEHIIDAKKLIQDISSKLNDGGLLYLTTPNLLHKKLIGDTLIKQFPIEDGNHVVRGYSIQRLKKLLEKNNLYIISKSFLTGPFSIFLINLNRRYNFMYLRFFIAPMIILANLLDRVFFKNYKNNLSIALVVEKIS